MTQVTQDNYRLLREIAGILKGKEIVINPAAQKEKYLLFNPVNIQDGRLQIAEDSVYVEKQEDLIELHERDLIFYRNNDTLGIYFVREDDPPCYLADPYILIRSTYSNYLDLFFKSELGKKVLQSQLSIKDRTGETQSDLAILRDLKIPMLNEELLKQLQSKAGHRFSEEDLAKMKEVITKSISTASLVGAGAGALGAAGLTGSAIAALTPFSAVALGAGAVGLFGMIKKNKKRKLFAAEKEKIRENEQKAVNIDQPVPVETVFNQVEKEMQLFLETGQLEEAPTEDKYRLQQLYMMREIYNLTKRVDKKMDLVLQSLEQLQIDLDDIRETDRNIEEKIYLISSRVDQRLGDIHETIKEDIRPYREILKRMITHWDDLDPLSQEFLPLAEYMYDKLGKMENADFSPVILQYCRSLENELLQKLFVGFSLYLYEKEKNLKVFLAEDFQNENTKKFAQPIYEKRNKPKESIQFTLGAMKFVLVLTKRDEIVEKSPLLREFRYFIKHSFREQFILTDEYIKQLQKIVDDYRNKCAHPYKLGKEKASQCRDIVPHSLNKFLQGFE